MNATTIPNIVLDLSATLEHVEAEVYRADKVFQAHVAPKVIAIATWCAVQFCRSFFAAAVCSYVAGRLMAVWFWTTVDCCGTPRPSCHVGVSSALPGFVPFGLLCAAPERVLITPHVEIKGLLLPGAEPKPLLITPAVAARAAAATARLNMGVRELRGLARAQGIKGYSKMSRAMLLSLLAA